MLQESAKRPKVFSIAIHHALRGQPARVQAISSRSTTTCMKQTGVLVWNGREMYEQWYSKNPDKFVGPMSDNLRRQLQAARSHANDHWELKLGVGS